MINRKSLLIGCGAAVLIAVVAIVAIVIGLMYLGQDPADVAATIESPPSVRLGEDFTMTVVVENQRTNRPFKLTSLDIGDEYIENFQVLSSDPPARSSTHVPLDNSRSFKFERTIPKLETMRFAFKLRPIRTGHFRGDVDACEGMRFLTALVDTRVESRRDPARP